jgi:hypothetical protein
MAYLLDQKEPVLVLAGYTVTSEAEDGTAKLELRFSEGSAIDVPIEFHDFLLFMQTPRLESEVFLWLEENGMSQATPRRLIRDWWLVSVPPGSYSEALAVFERLRVIPLCYITKASENFDDFYHVTIAEHDPKIRQLASLLGGVMWEDEKGEDLPSSANRLSLPSDDRKLAPPTAYSEEQQAKMILGDLHWLLENKYVRLERVEKESVPSGWLASILGQNK